MNIFKQAAKALGLKAQPPKKKFVLWPTWTEGVASWTLTSVDALVTEGFELNSIIYAAVMYKARAFSSVPLLAYDPDGELLPPTDPLSRLIIRPHPHASFRELSKNLSVFYNLFGEAYVYAVRRSPNQPPAALYALRPDRVRHIYRGGELFGYEYIARGAAAGSGVPLLAEDVMHVALPNPGDLYEGFGKGYSPLMAAAKSVDVDNSATDFLKLFFDHGALPSGVLQFETPLDDATVAQAQERWAAIYGGYQKWVEPAVLDSGGKYQRIGLSIQELELSGVDARTEARISMVLGVPITLIETRPNVTQSTYSNAEQARRMFWEDTMTSELRDFETEWQYLLGGEWGSVRFDLSGVSALESARAERAAMLATAYAAGAATTDEYRAALGLPADPRGPLFYVPLGAMLQPAVIANTEAQEQLTGATAESERRASPAPRSTKGLTLESKARVGKAIDQTATRFEDNALRAARLAFKRDQRELLAILGAAKSAAYEERKSVVWQFVLMDALAWVQGAGKENWRKELIPTLEATILAQGAQLNATFGMNFNVRNLLAEEWFKQYELTFVDPISATTEQTLSDMFSRAMAEGWSVPDMEKALDTLFTQWAYGTVSDPQDRYFAEQRLPPYRGEVIARTETIRASNAGASALYKDWGVKFKEWWATADGRTRDTHRVGAAFGDKPLVVGINEPFIIGGVPIMYPGDPGAPLRETAQCRCTVLPVLD